MSRAHRCPVLRPYLLERRGGSGPRLVASVHHGRSDANAFWVRAHADRYGQGGRVGVAVREAREAVALSPGQPA